MPCLRDLAGTPQVTWAHVLIFPKDQLEDRLWELPERPSRTAAQADWASSLEASWPPGTCPASPLPAPSPQGPEVFWFQVQKGSWTPHIKDASFHLRRSLFGLLRELSRDTLFVCARGPPGPWGALLCVPSCSKTPTLLPQLGSAPDTLSL